AGFYIPSCALAFISTCRNNRLFLLHIVLHITFIKKWGSVPHRFSTQKLRGTDPKGEVTMRIFHTADWHLGKLVQGVYMTEDQRFILEQFIEAIKTEQPDVVIVAGDLYDRAVPPTEAIHLLNEVLDTIVLQLGIPVLAIAGNHDSPSRLDFGSKLMEKNGYHIVGQLTESLEPVILHDEHGEVHFHLVPYCDPSLVRTIFNDDDVRTHHDAMQKIIKQITKKMAPNAR